MRIFQNGCGCLMHVRTLRPTCFNHMCCEIPFLALIETGGGKGGQPMDVHNPAATSDAAVMEGVFEHPHGGSDADAAAHLFNPCRRRFFFFMEGKPIHGKLFL